MLKESFNDKKIFVTGHTGFKGIWLSLVLKEFGAKVYGYSLAPVNNSIYNDVHNSVFEQSWYEDIRNSKKLNEAIAIAQPDIIFHLAAQPLVIESYQNPLYTFDVNVMGTVGLLDVLKNYTKSCAVIVITTDKVYENLEQGLPFRESDRLGGHDPYSTSKACVEMVVDSFRKSFFLAKRAKDRGIAVASARAGNVIGGGDWSAHRIIPDIVRAFHSKQTLEVRNPRSVRPWQHVLDALYGYILLAEKLITDSGNEKLQAAWNFGPLATDNLSVNVIVEMAAKQWGEGHYQFKESDADTLHEAGLLMLDSSKAQQLLNWIPVWNATTAVTKTLDWYKKVLIGHQSPANIALEQIREFLSETKA